MINLLRDLGWGNFDSGVPPFCPASKRIMPNSCQSKWADGGTLNQSQPNPEVSPIKCDIRECVVRTSDSRECVVGDSQRDDAKESVVETADSQECVVSASSLLPKIVETAHFIATGLNF